MTYTKTAETLSGLSLRGVGAFHKEGVRNFDELHKNNRNAVLTEFARRWCYCSHAVLHLHALSTIFLYRHVYIGVYIVAQACLWRVVRNGFMCSALPPAVSTVAVCVTCEYAFSGLRPCKGFLSQRWCSYSHCVLHLHVSSTFSLYRYWYIGMYIVDRASACLRGVGAVLPPAVSTVAVNPPARLDQTLRSLRPQFASFAIGGGLRLPTRFFDCKQTPCSQRRKPHEDVLGSKSEENKSIMSAWRALQMGGAAPPPPTPPLFKCKLPALFSH